MAQSPRPPPGYDAKSVISDMRKLNLLSANSPSAPRAQGQVNPSQVGETGQGMAPPSPAPPQQQAQQQGFDFEADQLASALESALNDPAPLPTHPQQQHQHIQQHSTQPFLQHPGHVQHMPAQQQSGMPQQQYTRMPQQLQQPPQPQYAQQHQHPSQPYHAPAPMGAPGQAYGDMPPPMMHVQPHGQYASMGFGGGAVPQYHGIPQVRRGGLDGFGRPCATSRMKEHELKRLIDQQHNAVSTEDSLSDDYYFIKYTEKMQRLRQMQQIQQQRPTDLLEDMQALLTSGSVVNAPFSSAHKALPHQHLGGDLTTKMEKTTVAIAKKRDQWHNDNKVLGRSVRSSLKQPRELISKESRSIGGDGAFKSQLWLLRGILGQISLKLINISDVQDLMQAKIGAARGFSPGTVAYTEASKVVETLQRKLTGLCDELGELLGFPSLIDPETGTYSPDQEVELVGGWDALFFLIWTPKGRRLVLRAISCLLGPHLRSVLKTMCTNCAYFVCRNPDGQDQVPPEDEEAELDIEAVRVFSGVFRSMESLNFVTECLRCFHTVFQESPVLSVFVHIPAGQEMIRTLLHHGKALSAAPGKASSSEQAAWTSESEKFYNTMKVAVSNLEAQQEST
mmetsp:Transcript_12460/g.22210  ORF Transcript_12460/g.22210 Transcript_12460/m.22210 type:complete len:621 (+) Transcript_12460:128-1990(+)